MAPTAGMRLRFKNAQSKKAQRPNHQVKKMPSLKNRIRGLERFLKRGGIADATRRAKQAELEQLKQEHEAKEKAAQDKQNVEKYKRPRFFERVKIMRKLRQAKARVAQAEDDAERAKHEKSFETYRQEMLYIYYYPKTEPYLSLFPPAPHSVENQQRQKELRAQALERFEQEQPLEAFHHFCFKDAKTGDEAEVDGSKPQSAVDLLLKKPSKEEVKKQKKAHRKRDKAGAKTKRAPALVDQEDDEVEMEAAVAGEGFQQDKQDEDEEEEEDDFFL